MPACIAGEVRAVLDLAFGERAGVKHPEGVVCEAEGFPLALEVTALQGYPAQRAPASPAQERPVTLPATSDTLKLTETSIFRNSKSLPQERHFLSVPEKL
jgi:hypothetical protein